MPSSLLQTLTQFGNILQGWLWPRLEEELGSLTAKQEQLVRVLGLLGRDGWIAPRRGRVRRPRRDRVAIARAFVAKAVYNLPSTRALREQLKSDGALRRICGWESARAVPDESVFSRSFAEFAETELPQRVHAALIAKTQSERLIGHISRDSTAIAVRERPVKAAHAAARPAKEAAAPATGQPSDKRRRPRQLTRIERQKEMTLEEMLAELPRHCSIGCKTNSQAAIPLATLTAARVTSLYDLMDSAYDSDLIRKHSQELGHVPIIESQGRRFKPARPMLPHEADRFRERTSVERVTARLKDEFGGRNVRVRGALKVMAHLMFGILVLTVDQILRLSP
jgi:hypothetical protein